MWGEPPPTTRKAAAYQVGKSECRAGKGLGPRVHLSIKNTGSEIILLIDVLSSSARVSWKSGSASYDAEGGHHQKIPTEPPTRTPRHRKGLRIDTDHTEVKRQAARGPHQRYSVRVVGDRARGRRGLLAEGLHLLLGLNQHAPTLRVLLP